MLPVVSLNTHQSLSSTNHCSLTLGLLPINFKEAVIFGLMVAFVLVKITLPYPNVWSMVIFSMRGNLRHVVPGGAYNEGGQVWFVVGCHTGAGFGANAFEHEQPYGTAIVAVRTAIVVLSAWLATTAQELRSATM